jgi:hypothetical protein
MLTTRVRVTSPPTRPPPSRVNGRWTGERGRWAWKQEGHQDQRKPSHRVLLAAPLPAARFRRRCDAASRPIISARSVPKSDQGASYCYRWRAGRATAPAMASATVSGPEAEPFLLSPPVEHQDTIGRMLHGKKVVVVPRLPGRADPRADLPGDTEGGGRRDHPRRRRQQRRHRGAGSSPRHHHLRASPQPWLRREPEDLLHPGPRAEGRHRRDASPRLSIRPPADHGHGRDGGLEVWAGRGSSNTARAGGRLWRTNRFLTAVRTCSWARSCRSSTGYRAFSRRSWKRSPPRQLGRLRVRQPDPGPDGGGRVLHRRDLVPHLLFSRASPSASRGRCGTASGLSTSFHYRSWKWAPPAAHPRWLADAPASGAPQTRPQPDAGSATARIASGASGPSEADRPRGDGGPARASGLRAEAWANSGRAASSCPFVASAPVPERHLPALALEPAVLYPCSAQAQSSRHAVVSRSCGCRPAVSARAASAP